MTRRQLLLLAGVLSAATLGGAFFFQYVMAMLPCHLCILQRYPQAVLVGLALLGLAIQGRLVPALGVVTAVVSLGLAIYHSGVERQLWAGPSDCTGGQDLSRLSGTDLLSTEVAAPIVRCDEIAYQFFGLSFANMNMLVSVVLIGLWVMALRRS